MASFTPKLGYIHDDAGRAGYVPLSPAVKTLFPSLDGYEQWQAPLLVQNYQDCVFRALVSRMRARIVMQRTAQARAELPLPDLASSRFLYYKYLEETGQLGLDPGSQPWDVVECTRKHGWCAEKDWAYPTPNDDGTMPAFDEQHAPPIGAARAANDQREDQQQQGQALRAHQLTEAGGRLELQQALSADLGVLKPFALDQRIVTPGGIPDDPEFVWEFDESSSVAGWHMLQVDAYHPVKGIRCPNTWGPGFGFNGYVWISWTTALSTRRSLPAIALDMVRQTTQEIAEALQ